LDGADAPEETAAARVADELRAAIRALSERRVGAADLSRARALAAELNGALTGPRASRWYEDDPSAEAPARSTAHEPSRASRSAFLRHSPLRGRANPIAPPMVFDVPTVAADGRRVIRARATLGTPYEGPPHGVHGGIVAAMFDELLGSTQQLSSQTGVTAKLTVLYREITPLGEELAFEAWIEEVRGRRVIARATCHAAGALTAEAEALFVGVDFEEIQERMKRRRTTLASEPEP